MLLRAWPEVAISRCDTNTFTPEQAVDLVISNPPYFDNALKAGSDKRTLARHTDSLPLVNYWVCGSEPAAQPD